MGTTSNSIMSTKLPIWRGRGEVVVGFGCKYKKEAASKTTTPQSANAHAAPSRPPTARACLHPVPKVQCCLRPLPHGSRCWAILNEQAAALPPQPFCWRGSGGRLDDLGQEGGNERREDGSAQNQNQAKPNQNKPNQNPIQTNAQSCAESAGASMSTIASSSIIGLGLRRW